MKARALIGLASLPWFTLAIYACGGSAGNSASSGDGGLSAACTQDTEDPPHSIACTGLYVDVTAKSVVLDARAYTPAVPLWSDSASKGRWIQLPKGQVIDNSDPNEWSFPVGTKAWKEFSREGKRIETRYFHKQSAGYWVSATYVWNADESDAQRNPGGDISLPSGATYHVPTSDECTQCHRGRTDALLGFEQASLGMPGATGLTLTELVAENLLTQPPAQTTLTIGDDGTNAAAPALAWLHINCGVACHNANSNSTGYGAGMRLRLDATQLDGRTSVNFDSRTTTINVVTNTPQWSGLTRIVPGDVTDSLLLQLISQRDADDQMPPIATSIVDTADVALVQSWIAHMPLAQNPDAGAPDAGGDASPDSGSDSGSASGPDSGSVATADAGDGGVASDAALSDASDD